MTDPPPSPAVCDNSGNVLYVARARDTDEEAIRAAKKRGVELPQFVTVRRGPVICTYEIIGEGNVIIRAN